MDNYEEAIANLDQAQAALRKLLDPSKKVQEQFSLHAIIICMNSIKQRIND